MPPPPVVRQRSRCCERDACMMCSSGTSCFYFDLTCGHVLCYMQRLLSETSMLTILVTTILPVVLTQAARALELAPLRATPVRASTSCAQYTHDLCVPTHRHSSHQVRRPACLCAGQGSQQAHFCRPCSMPRRPGSAAPAHQYRAGGKGQEAQKGQDARHVSFKSQHSRARVGKRPTCMIGSTGTRWADEPARRDTGSTHLPRTISWRTMRGPRPIRRQATTAAKVPVRRVRVLRTWRREAHQASGAYVLGTRGAQGILCI